MQESKATLSASRLKSEVDAHRETRENLDKTINHLSETRAEIDQTRKECEDFMKKLKDEEENKQKKAKAAEQEQTVKLMIDAAAEKELDTLRDNYTKVTEENSQLSEKCKLWKKRTRTTRPFWQSSRTRAKSKSEILKI